MFLIWGGEQFTQKAQRIVTEFKKLQIQRKNEHCLSLTRLTNKIFLHTKTVCEPI